MPKVNRTKARAEAVRCAAEAISRRRAGETLSAIYDDLKERGEITLALRTFMRWIGRLEREPLYQAPVRDRTNDPAFPLLFDPSLVDKRATQLSPAREKTPASDGSEPLRKPRHGIAGVVRPVPPDSEIDPKELF